jgi:hypothetical protein
MTYSQITRILTIHTQIPELYKAIRELEEERAELRAALKAEGKELPAGDAITPEAIPTGNEINPDHPPCESCGDYVENYVAVVAMNGTSTGLSVCQTCATVLESIGWHKLW